MPFILTSLPVWGVQAQTTRTISGETLSEGDSTRLTGVTVSVLNTNLVTVTDATGSFMLRGVPGDTVLLLFTRIGIHADSVTLPATENFVRVFLRAAAVEIDPLVATALPAARERFEEAAQTSTITIDREVIGSTPAFFEADILRTVQLLPGTVALNDYTIGYHTRGGEADQNLIQLDGATVFNPSHLGGLFSTFDAEAIDEVDYLTGGFPAHYGGRLSSVLDTRMRAGRDRFAVSGQVSLLSSKLLIEGGIPGTSGTYLFSGRRTYADRVVEALSSEVLPYYFADGLGRLTFPLPGGGTISGTGYWGRDVLDWEFVKPTEEQPGIDLEVNWGNSLAAVNVNHSMGARPFQLHLSRSGFSTRVGLVPDIVNVQNDVRLWNGRAMLHLTPGSSHDVRVGGGVEDYDIRYLFESAVFGATFLEQSYGPRIWSAFIDDEWEPNDWLKLRPGLRLESIEGADFTSLAPRIAVKAFLTPEFALTGSAGRYYQGLHSLRDHNVPWSFLDFWIGADSVTPVARSDHMVLGFERWFGSGISFGIEGYRKTFANIVNFDYRDDLKVQGDEYFTTTGNAWGADVLLRKYTGRFTGWIAYSLGKATRHSAEQSFPPAHDRRHTLNVVVRTNGPLGSELGVRWGYGSPLPYTPFIGQWEHRYYNPATHSFIEANEEPVASQSLNTARFPAYSRLDISLRWDTGFFGGRLKPYLHLLNAYNRGNVFFYVFDFTSSPSTRQAISQLPLLPSFGVEFEF